jgi:spiro-SPASM protein
MIVCVYAGRPSPYLGEPVGDSTTIERVSSFVSSLPDVTRVVVLGTEEISGVPAEWEQLIHPSWDVSGLVGALADLVEGPDDVLAFTFLDQPFLNRELASRLLDRHTRHRADYTFADGYPTGLAIELLRGRSLAYLRELSSGLSGDVAREALFTVIQKDMNRFDIETELSRTDQRLLRLTLAVDTKANHQICDAFAQDAPDEIDLWPEHVAARSAIHRSRPRYVSVQVIEQDVHEVTYSPYPGVHGQVLAPGAIMGVAKFDKLIGELHEYSPEAVVSISHWGELSLYPNVMRLVDAVISRPPLKLVIETSGVGWQSDVRDELLSRDRIVVIVGLDSHDPIVYRDIRGEGFAEAVEFAEAALAAIPDRTYVQAVRCDLTEPTLDDFYKHWIAKTENVIIQKYDWFSGKLLDRRVGDIAPLNRFPCWHLQRDMTVLVDGGVPLCREDLARKHVLGNVFDSSLVEVWEAGASAYEEHVAGTYRGICEQCDEYYTFNF